MTKHELFDRLSAILQETFDIEPSRASSRRRACTRTWTSTASAAIDLLVRLKPVAGQRVPPGGLPLRAHAAGCGGRSARPAWQRLRRRVKRLRPVLLGLVSLAYPLLVYLGLGHFEPRWMALPLAGMAVLRAVATREKMWLAAAVGARSRPASMLGNHALPLKLYPVLVNAVLLTVFATSLLLSPQRH